MLKRYWLDERAEAPTSNMLLIGASVAVCLIVIGYFVSKINKADSTGEAAAGQITLDHEDVDLT